MKIAVIGRSEILYDSAERLAAAGHEIVLVVTAREAPEYTRTAADFRALAGRNGARFISAAALDPGRHGQAITAAGAAAAVSVNFPGILSREIVELFPLGILNAHGGDLPRYRGNACQAWAILNGEKHIGVCVHRMEGGSLDSGDILARDYLPLDETVYIGRVWQWLGERIPELFAEALARLQADPGYVLARQADDPRPPLRCYPRTPADGRIHWERSAPEIQRLVRASGRPYAGAFCTYSGRRLTVLAAETVADDEQYCAVPGQVCAVSPEDGTVTVITGRGKLRLTEVEYQGRCGRPADFITGIRRRLE